MNSNDENNFLTTYNNNNVEKEKKYAKLMIFFASLGVLAGLSASYTFFFIYKLVETPVLAIISGGIASLVIYIHIQYVRNYWQIWTYQLKYWSLAGFVLQALFSIIFLACLVLGIYYKQGNLYSPKLM